jgi:amino acid adenylation domain-containing protein
MTESPQGLAVACEYSTELFEAERIRRWIGHFQTLLRGIAESPDLSLSELPLMSEDEQKKILVEWNRTETRYAENKTVIDLFEEQVARTPDKAASLCAGVELTYRQLDERAAQLANVLAARGVGPETLVGVCMQRSTDLIVAILAVLKAGGAYVPIDPEYPTERLQYIAADSQLSLMLTDDRTDSAVPGIATVCVPRLNAAGVERKPLHRPKPENLAYVIYTSGSTGKPKGVMVTHRNVANFFTGMDEVIGPEPGVWLAVTSICFDISVLELLWTLSRGFKVVLQRDRQAVENRADAIPAQIFRHGVTHFQGTPSLAAMLMQEPDGLKALRTVKKVLLGGEPLPAWIADKLTDAVELINVYGPTETTVWSTACKVRAGEEITIGRPIANTQIYILDRNLQPSPIGVPGEIYIGGVGVTRGYLNRSELTAERFIENPFTTDDAARMYRTGDLGRWLPDGRIECLGRADFQVKIRGHRIEPGEIEAKLSQHPQISEVAVAPVEDAATGLSLVAFIILKKGASIDAGELRQFLKRSLPEYMIPSAFMCVDSFPLTPNGKIDRKTLPLRYTAVQAGSDQKPARDGIAPRTPTEERLSAIWQDVLKLPLVMVDQDFFTLGGHSILALQVMARVRETFGCDVPLRRLFDSPTIAELAKVIEETLLEEIVNLSDEEAVRLSSDSLARSTP